MKIWLLILLTLCSIFCSTLRADPASYFLQLQSSDSDRGLIISGEGGAAFFATGKEGDFPNKEFRIDEAKLFVDASLGYEAYVFVEVNIATREVEDENFHIGELYLELENLSRLWGGTEGLLNLRFGRMDIPFGEEYLTRDAIDNPLISHSLEDIWGVDEGLEVYGRAKKVSYVLAVQNGGQPFFRDFNPDKAVVGRFSVDATPAIHASVSAMRTGALDVFGDQISATWFANGFLRALGPTPPTTEFHGDFLQADLQLHGRKGALYGAGGALHYKDNDPLTDNSRNVYYYQVGGVYDLVVHGPDKFFAAARFSAIDAAGGFPLVGHGNFSHYFNDPFDITRSLWRFSVGGGYRWGEHLLLKSEYTFERGKELDGNPRSHEDFFGVEAAFKF